MTDKIVVNAVLDNLANAVRLCKKYDIITREMVEGIIKSEWEPTTDGKHLDESNKSEQCTHNESFSKKS